MISSASPFAQPTIILPKPKVPAKVLPLRELMLGDKAELIAKLQGSLLLFCQTFYPLLTNLPFTLPNPQGRECHVITICRALTAVTRGEVTRLNVNVPPGHFKTTLLCLWVAQTLSIYPDSRYLYISYSSLISTKATAMIKEIISLPAYKALFNVFIRQDSKAKDSFSTTAGGEIGAFGSGGSITGNDGGRPGLDRFGGAVIIDDAHKINEAASETTREGVITNYKDTIKTRLRDFRTPLINIGQRVHESDLANYFISGQEGSKWTNIIIPALDVNRNPIYPEAHPLEELELEEKNSPYTFAAQKQQNPMPAGGALFKPEWFALLNEEPEYLKTFITADTAETTDPRNDATVFSFWGIYKIKDFGKETDVIGLHWINCVEIRVEPKDLRDEFMQFWAECADHVMPPAMAAIEKKSTGVTLLSVLSDMRGIHIRNIERTVKSGSKSQRFIDAQEFIASKRISLTKHAPHVEMCLNHMSKITASNVHAFDDIADTCADAIRIALIDKSLYDNTDKQHGQAVLSTISNKMKTLDRLRSAQYGHRN